MKYAIVMTASGKWEEIVSAALNGLTLFGNEVDVHLIPKEMDQAWLDSLPSWVKVQKWEDAIDHDLPAHKGGGWEVRYYRYAHVRKIKDDYDAVMILDADVFVSGNIMDLFQQAKTTGQLIMPFNPRGCSIEAGMDSIRGAASPPFHCHPNFFDPKKYDYLMADMYKYGLEEDYGDMAQLYRCLMRHDLQKTVIGLNNDLFCFTDWHEDFVTWRDGDLPTLWYKDEQIVVVHRRWHMKSVRDKFVGDLGPRHREFGENNVNLFKKYIDWLNENGPIKWQV